MCMLIYTFSLAALAVIIHTTSSTTAPKTIPRSRLMFEYDWPEPDLSIIKYPHEEYCDYYYFREPVNILLYTVRKCLNNTSFDYHIHECKEKQSAQCWSDRYGKYKFHDSASNTLLPDPTSNTLLHDSSINTSLSDSTINILPDSTSGTLLQNSSSSTSLQDFTSNALLSDSTSNTLLSDESYITEEDFSTIEQSTIPTPINCNIGYSKFRYFEGSWSYRGEFEDKNVKYYLLDYSNYAPSFSKFIKLYPTVTVYTSGQASSESTFGDVGRGSFGTLHFHTNKFDIGSPIQYEYMVDNHRWQAGYTAIAKIGIGFLKENTKLYLKPYVYGYLRSAGHYSRDLTVGLSVHKLTFNP